MIMNTAVEPIHSLDTNNREWERMLRYLEWLWAHNSKEWFHDKEHQKEYQYVRKQFKQLVWYLKEELVQFDPTMLRLPVKKIIFRINRDVRYSRDKSPYKRNFWASFAQKWWTQSNYAGYYLHIQPWNNSFVWGGLYYPEKQVLDALRVHLEYEWEKLETILKDDALVQFFWLLQWRSLKTRPRGYSQDTPYLHLIRRKDFYLSHPISDKSIIDGSFYEEVVYWFTLLNPFISALNEPLQLESIQ